MIKQSHIFFIFQRNKDSDEYLFFERQLKLFGYLAKVRIINMIVYLYTYINIENPLSLLIVNLHYLRI
jgi:hypothetical protein